MDQTEKWIKIQVPKVICLSVFHCICTGFFLSQYLLRNSNNHCHIFHHWPFCVGACWKVADSLAFVHDSAALKSVFLCMALHGGIKSESMQVEMEEEEEEAKSESCWDRQKRNLEYTSLAEVVFKTARLICLFDRPSDFTVIIISYRV